MARKVPLIYNTSTNRLEELALVDELDLSTLSLTGNTTQTLSLTSTPPSTSDDRGFLSVGPNLSFSDANKIATFTTSVDAYSQIMVQNKSSGTSASADVIVNNDRVLGNSTYGDFGINSSAFNLGGAFGDIDGTYLYAAGGTLSVGCFGANDFRIGTDNTVRLSVLSTGQIQLASGSLLGTQTAGAVEYDGTFAYLTENTTSGRAHIPVVQTFRLTADGAAVGTGDYFGTTSSINLSASSVYEITYHIYTTKTTNGTITWTLTASSAPTLINAHYLASPTGGIASGTLQTAYTGSVGATTAAFASYGTVGTGSSVAFTIKATVVTNAATNFRLSVTNSNGTVTPKAGSFYKVERISTTSGSFA